MVEDEWGGGLIRSWNTAGWIDLSQRIGDKIARLVGAGAGEVIVADSTSVNLYKVLSAALALARRRRAATQRDPVRAHQLSHRPLHRRFHRRARAGSSCGSWMRDGLPRSSTTASRSCC